MHIDFTGFAPGGPQVSPTDGSSRVGLGRGARMLGIWALALAGWAVAIPAAEVVDAPEAPTADNAFDDAPLPVSGGRPAPSLAQRRENQPAFGSGRHATVADTAAAGDGAGRVARSPLGSVFWVMVYLGVMGFGLWVVMKLTKKYLPGSQKYFAHPAMEVLGRAPLDAKRYLALVRVGKRLLVVGVAPESLGTISDISDPDEVTAILEVSRPTSEPGKQVFQQLFQRQTERLEAEERVERTRVEAEGLSAEVADLRERVRSLRENE